MRHTTRKRFGHRQNLAKLALLPGLQSKVKGQGKNKFFCFYLFLNQTLWYDHSLESSQRDDFNDVHAIGFGREMK